MSEPEDGGSSSTSFTDMDVHEYDVDDTITLEFVADDVEIEEIIDNQPITVRSSARIPTRASARLSARASAQSTSRAPVSPTRSPIRLQRQHAPGDNLYTVSDNSVLANLVTYGVITQNRFEIGYIRPVSPFPVPPLGSYHGENEQATTLNQSSSMIVNVEPIDFALQPTTSQESSENTMNDNNRDVSSCPICLDDFNNAGPHKPACLKCGHIFGESCIQRWIRIGCNNEAKRCPTCNTKATLKDIRVLYANKLIAVDTAQLTKALNDLEKKKIENDLMEAELHNYRLKHTNLKEEVKRLRSLVDTGKPKPTSMGPTLGRQCLKKIKLNGTNPDCRVIAFNRNNMMLVVSQVGEGPFSNCHGIRKLNALVLEPTKEFILPHKKQIRDMAFHPIDHNQLATVSLDKSVCLTDVSSNTVVSNVGVGEPLWCCCWAGNNTNVLIVGGQMGSLYFFDRRYMKLLEELHSRNPACVSLTPISAATSRAFPLGGFLKTRMDCLTIFEQDPHPLLNYKEHNLPLKGKWSSSAYDVQSNLLLTSAKPCGANQSIRHVISKVSDLNEEGPLIQPVVTFYGGDKATQLTRSCFVPSNDVHDNVLVCGFDEKSKAIKIFDVGTNTNVHNFSVNEMFTDICPLNGVSMNGRRTIAALSNCAVSIFSV